MEQSIIEKTVKVIKGRSIFLIGMMGCGKSQTGLKLAELLKYKYIDLDLLIEKLAKKSINQIFNDEGEDNFRELEANCLKETIKIPSLVISTGGGIVTKSENWGILRQGIIAWIDLDKDIAIERLKNEIENRPLLQGKNLYDLYMSIFQSRENLYSQADLILLVDAARITNAAKAGLLQPIESSNLENDVPVGLKDPNKEWYALTRRVRVLIANPKVVDVSKINDYTDLADPSLKGKVCLRNRKSPYNQSLVANQIINKGESETKAWLSGMISNVSKPFFPGDIAIIRAVSKKKCGVGIVNHYYVARMLAGVNGRRDALYAKKTIVLTPNPAHVNISAGGVAKYATNKNEAIKLLEYLASPKGSKGLAAPTFEHPLKEVNQNPIVKDFGEFTPDKVTVDDLGVNNPLAIKLMKDAGWN